MMNPAEEAARLWVAGYLVLPLKIDGSKAPIGKWGYLKSPPRPDWNTYRQRFHERVGLAIIGGRASGGVEALDFDNHHHGDVNYFKEWCTKIPDDLLKKLVIYRTPADGFRVVWKYPAEYNASVTTKKRTRETMAKITKETCIIELLGECVIIVPGGSVKTHKSGTYKYIRGHLIDVKEIGEAEHDCLVDAAKTFNVYTPPVCPPSTEQTYRKYYDKECYAPNWWASDDFNIRGSWHELLESAGWTHWGESPEGELWRRPGKTEGNSATLHPNNNGLLTVFTSSTAFEPDKTYNKFAAYTILHCDGDFKASAKKLAALRYGQSNRLDELEERIKKMYGWSPVVQAY
jgi:hypothetical protein